MSNSSLICYTKLSPNHSGKRTRSIDRITPHCIVGQLSCQDICGCFTDKSVKASCNYGIGKDGKRSLCVDEGNRSWCTSSNANDQRAVTIECASDKTDPYAMTDAVYNSLIELCVDICRRNGKKKLIWFGNKNKTLNYDPAADEMIITVHRWFANKACPGDWLYNRLGNLASRVTSILAGDEKQNAGDILPSTDTVWYRIRKTWSDSKGQIGAYHDLTNAKALADKNPGYYVFDESGVAIYPGQTFVPYMVNVKVNDLQIRTAPSVDARSTGSTGKGSFTIVDEKTGKISQKGATGTWGHLKAYAKDPNDGWICLAYKSYTEKL